MERRAWDLNPRDFRLPVFKTGALGRYASPPWGNLPVALRVIKIKGLQRGLHMQFEPDRKHMDRHDGDHGDHHRKVTLQIESIKYDEER